MGIRIDRINHHTYRGDFSGSSAFRYPKKQRNFEVKAGVLG